MRPAELVLRNLRYHWRGNCAVLLGVVVGTAVLTGALLVGDSLRGSLRDQALRQLGDIEEVVVAGRLFREEVTTYFEQDHRGEALVLTIPALILNGAIVREAETGKGGAARAGKVTILGVDQRFWGLWPKGGPPLGDLEGVVLNDAVARELKARPGDVVTVSLQKMATVPRESILGQQEAGDVLFQFKMKVAAILRHDDPGSRFSLNPSPATPRNVFVSLKVLQRELSKAQPDQTPAHPINALLSKKGAWDLRDRLPEALNMEDWGLRIRGPEQRARAFFASLKKRNRAGVIRPSDWPRLEEDRALARQVLNAKGVMDVDSLIAYYKKHHNYLSLESRQLFIEDAVARADPEMAKHLGLTAAPTLVYLADKISAGKDRELSYAVVAALDPALPPPLGLFLPRGLKEIPDDHIVLVNWKGTPIPPDSGVIKVRVSYYDAEEQDELRTRELTVAGWIDMKGAADDPDLTPEFPGITDQVSMDDWSPPSSMHFKNNRVAKPRDEDYWKAYRTTPKAYVNLKTGQKLWGSRFGNLTSIRLALTEKGDSAKLEAARKRMEEALPRSLKPEEGGWVFDAVKERALAASGGSNDFSMLFLGFSVFIIVAALLLVGLLFRLNLDRRASEIGLLLATGIPRRTLRWLLVNEGGFLAALGGLIGLAGAVGYAWLLLEYLRASWPGELDQSFLTLHGTPASFAIGYGASVLVSLLTILWATRVLGRVAPRALLAGETSEATDLQSRGRPGRWRLVVGVTCLGGAVACLVGGNYVTDHEMRAMTFFGSGMLLLVAGLIEVWAYLRRDPTAPSRHVTTLGIHNANRHPVRSLLTVGLLASATFLVIAVESFHKDPSRDFRSRNGGSGGFTLVGETDVPLFLDTQTMRGKDDLDLILKQNVSAEERDLVKQATIFSFRLKSGDDASCLNLAQPRRPRLLGVGHTFVKRGGFRFQDSEAASAEARANPWTLLEGPDTDGAIPAIGDATTVTWMLKSGLGKEVEVVDGNGQPRKLRIVGLLQDSIFQSELLISDASFRKLYPSQGGFQFFLIETPESQAPETKQALEKALARQGFSATSTFQRLETYLAVENTYLSTFQALGGLGLLLGALGLAVVLLRSVWERRGELALLRALGFRRSALGWLVLAENALLLALGLGVGTIAALIAVAPHLAAGTGEVPVLRLLVLLALVLAAGLGAGTAAMAATVRAPLVPALRRE
jgi:ABC-type antimicrobial peptide transport system permease subunit